MALELRGLVRSFGGIHAVDGVSFEVHEREIVGVIGPNGAGKTTLFDLVSGFLPVDDGQVLLGGRDVTHASPAARAAAGLGRSFQDALLFPEMTVHEALAVAERALDRAPQRARRRAPAADRLRRRGTHGGPHRGAARADGPRPASAPRSSASCRPAPAASSTSPARSPTDPTVILLDEPSSGIAQREVEALAPVLRRLRDEMGSALVVIEHDIPLVSAIADRLVALDMGRVVATGPPDEVLAHPQVVESYLGTSSAAISRSGTRG